MHLLISCVTNRIPPGKEQPREALPQNPWCLGDGPLVLGAALFPHFFDRMKAFEMPRICFNPDVSFSLISCDWYPDLESHSWGWQFSLFVMDEPTRHDASAIVEMIALTLEDIYSTCARTGGKFPTSLLVISDNTVREAKNQILLAYLNNLTSHFKFQMAGLLNLRKSHTHDKLDAVWGILARRIAASDKLLSPRTVMEILDHEMSRPGMKAFIGLGTTVKICKLDAARAWKNHFLVQRIGLSGGLLEDNKSNHCFISLLRRGWFWKKHIGYMVTPEGIWEFYILHCFDFQIFVYSFTYFICLFSSYICIHVYINFNMYI